MSKCRGCGRDADSLDRWFFCSVSCRWAWVARYNRALKNFIRNYRG